SPAFPLRIHLRQPPLWPSSLFPYTTLFRSNRNLSSSSRLSFRLRHSGVGAFNQLAINVVTSRRTTIARIDVVHALVQHLAQILQDRKSTRLNSSHVKISYAVFCLKQKRASR